MITAKIKYTGNNTGMLARFYSDYQSFGKFNTREELLYAYSNWVKLSKSDDWKLFLEEN